MSAGARMTGSAGRRQRVFAIIQIAASFVLLAGAATLLKTLLALQAAQTGLDVRHVLAVDLPVLSYGRTPEQIDAFYKQVSRRIGELPGVDQAAIGVTVPWRAAGNFGPGFQFSADGHVRAPAEEDPRARFRAISPGFFAALGVPIIAGHDFTDADRRGSESVVIVSQSLASRMFPNGEALNRHVMWTDPVMKFADVSPAPPAHRRRGGRYRRRKYRAQSNPHHLSSPGASFRRKTAACAYTHRPLHPGDAHPANYPRHVPGSAC